MSIYKAEQGDSIEMVQFCSPTESIIVIEIISLYKRTAWDLQSQCKTRSSLLHNTEWEHFANNSTDFNVEWWMNVVLCCVVLWPVIIIICLWLRSLRAAAAGEEEEHNTIPTFNPTLIGSKLWYSNNTIASHKPPSSIPPPTRLQRLNLRDLKVLIFL